VEDVLGACHKPGGFGFGGGEELASLVGRCEDVLYEPCALGLSYVELADASGAVISDIE